MVTDLKVGSVETVKIISAAIRTSRPKRIDFPIDCLIFLVGLISFEQGQSETLVKNIANQEK